MLMWQLITRLKQNGYSLKCSRKKKNKCYTQNNDYDVRYEIRI